MHELNGIWEAGLDRQYNLEAKVPGLVTDPSEITPGELWYRRRVALPPGDWTHATLILKGARFCPRVYVDSEQVSGAAGGMGPTEHLLGHPAVHPGGEIALEIALLPLDGVPADDASRIPGADMWRSNVASCLWDDVALRLHGPARIASVVPWTVGADQFDVSWAVERTDRTLDDLRIVTEILDASGRALARAEAEASGTDGRTAIDLRGACARWSPESPVCYTLRLRLLSGDRLLDEVLQTWGLREFRVAEKHFWLNDLPVHMRAGSVVWHRWCRGPEGRHLAWDVEWFEQNVVQRLKEHGANALRFHLGMPPESFLDLCDRYGLLVQAEWSFFHGMHASMPSLLEQWRAWIELCLRHPSVVLLHAWNETGGEQLEVAFAAIDELCRDLPPLVIGHRDVIHVHKYWWSLFENVGCYYDSADQFPQAIMADEFGGNYLDGDGEPGGYPALRESLLRFLGRGHTRDLRLQLHAEANARIAEYWRRLDAAGFSPFCLLGSWEDGNHHFLGPLAEGRPKPVWDALTAANAPVSCSLDVWDRNYLPGQSVTWPLHLFNETGEAQNVRIALRVAAEADPARVYSAVERVFAVPAYGHTVEMATFHLPREEGAWRLEAELLDAPYVTRPVLSAWRVRTLCLRLPKALHGRIVGVIGEDAELGAFCQTAGLRVTEDLGEVDLLVFSRRGWKQLLLDESLCRTCAEAIERGGAVVLFDIGPTELGQGYLAEGDLGPLQGVSHVRDPWVTDRELFLGIRLRFRELPEPESCLHPTERGRGLWEGLDRQATWLWNGLRGGLVAPACDLEVRGLSQDAFLAMWAGRGADKEAICSGHCIVYELAGFYAFSARPDDAVRGQLRAKVRFLVEDAPALAQSINPRAPIRELDLSAGWRASADGRAEGLGSLAECGKDLTRSPVVEVTFGDGKGVLVLSQLLTAGRLAPGYGHPDVAEPNPHYAIRPDPAAGQFVLNVLARAVRGRPLE